MLSPVSVRESSPHHAASHTGLPAAVPLFAERLIIVRLQMTLDKTRL